MDDYKHCSFIGKRLGMENVVAIAPYRVLSY